MIQNKPIGDYTAEELMAMTQDELKELERRALSVETDYICSGSAIDGGYLDKFSPEDLEEILDEGDPVGDLVLITSELGDAFYIMTVRDFLPESRVHDSENRMQIIECFENGVPEWLMPYIGLNYYLASWTDGKWKFKEYATV